MVEILAKSFKKDGEKITLSRHTWDTLKVFEYLENRIEDKRLIEAIKVAVFLHDLSKVLPAFQIKSLNNRDYEPSDVVYEIPHSLFSVFWIKKDELKNKFGKEYFNFIISAVSYHHWRENFDDFISRDNEIFIKLCKKIKEEWGEYLRENLLQEFSDFDGYKDYIDINGSWLKGIIKRRSFMNYAIPPYKFDYEPLRKEVKKDWILISGFLQRCDHFASWCEEEGENLNNVEIEPKRQEEIFQEVKNKIGEKAWQFNFIKEGNLILVAPTGYGKTEFAFLWSKGNKFIYTLPLRSAVNKIYDRAVDVFGKEKTGILHSDADVYLLEKASDMVDPIKVYETAKQISHPVLISTGDQFFPYGLRPPGYERVFSVFSYSKLIIDEVQAYDPSACAIIVKFVEWISKMGGKFLLMTATLPNFVKDRIKEINNVEIINIYEKEKENFKKFFKHKIKVKLIKNENSEKKYELPEEEIKRIVEEAEKGKRVLVILNTIDSAQRVFDRIKEYTQKNVYLLHSRFTFDDRKRKERELFEKFQNPKDISEKEGKILVSTQIVEASLDLDADIIFTEICPLDSLVQRMGRVLRRYFYRDGRVINKSDGKEYDITTKEFRTYENEPNVYIWVFEKDLCSGSNRVYLKELLNLSLAWLWKKKEVRDLENLLKERGILEDNNLNEEILKEIFKDLVSNEKGKGKRKENFYQKILEHEWRKEIDGIEIELSEYDKYYLVNSFYKSLNPDGDYLKKFYETINLLDAGWMSEKKSEAERLFREVYSIQVVPNNLLEDFKNDIKNFIEKENFNYTNFKTQIISKYCINVDLRIYMKEIGILSNNLKMTTELLPEISISRNFERIGKIQRWLSDIYYDRSSEYENEKGFITKQKRD
ncbi:MAG: CRISPR-associated helicase/endonuclease Cas3 [Dictyoglomus turgidum]|nr:MAG: CRISPR-associated helicase/endonuclease Cas3 [Dictyoglomus turgidum]